MQQERTYPQYSKELKKKDCAVGSLRNPRTERCAKCLGDTFTHAELIRYAEIIGIPMSPRDRLSQKELCRTIANTLQTNERSLFDKLVEAGRNIFAPVPAYFNLEPKKEQTMQLNLPTAIESVPIISIESKTLKVPPRYLLKSDGKSYPNQLEAHVSLIGTLEDLLEQLKLDKKGLYLFLDNDKTPKTPTLVSPSNLVKAITEIPELLTLEPRIGKKGVIVYMVDKNKNVVATMKMYIEEQNRIQKLKDDFDIESLAREIRKLNVIEEEDREPKQKRTQAPEPSPQRPKFLSKPPPQIPQKKDTIETLQYGPFTLIRNFTRNETSILKDGVVIETWSILPNVFKTPTFAFLKLDEFVGLYVNDNQAYIMSIPGDDSMFSMKPNHILIGVKNVYDLKLGKYIRKEDYEAKKSSGAINFNKKSF